MNVTSLGTKIDIDLIQTQDRVRQDFGDIDALAASIREHGLIQKIVLKYEPKSNGDSEQNPLAPPDNPVNIERITLVVGERRLRALKKLGLSTLIHNEHFYWNDELSGKVHSHEIDLRLKGIELEENVRRKGLTWQEEVIAKQRLLAIMVELHGESRPGQPSTAQRLGASPTGFGVNKLAALLGESNAATSKDLELARLITAVPQLAKAETKEAARRQAVLATVVATGLKQQKVEAAKPNQPVLNWTLYEGDFINNVNNIQDSSVDLVIVDPPYGEDVQGMAANSRQLLASGFADSEGDIVPLLGRMLGESYRCLRPDRFAVYFFGFTIYPALLEASRLAGFDVDITPLVWIKNTVINTSPYTRYSRAYEPMVVLRKGSPKLIRPSQRDVISLNTVTTVSGAETKFYHAQKPVELIEKFILDMTIPGATVVDFCAGSGTAGVAALKNKRKVVLFEKDPTACQIIRSRLVGL